MKNLGKSVNTVVEAVFRCSKCSNIAAKVELVPAGIVHPDALGGYAGTIVISGFMGKQKEVVTDEGFLLLHQALIDKDASKLYRINELWASFYCPECQATYCEDHWISWPIFEDDGYYDCTYGICPNNHKHLIND